MASSGPNWLPIMVAAAAVVMVMGAAVESDSLTSPEKNQDLAGHQESMMREDRTDEPRTCTSTSCPQPFLHDYMTFEEIEWFLFELNTHCSRVELTSIGKSYENRDIWMVHIKPPQEDHPSKAAWIEGGIHGNEWISPAVAINFVNYMAYSDDLLPPGMHVYVVPVANPDGYVYSFTGTHQRSWRKNRRHTNNPHCRGVDLNRNWDWKFGQCESSSYECDDKYHGQGPFSEPETLALKQAMHTVNNNCDLRLVLGLYSFGQKLLSAWAYTTNEAPYADDMIHAGIAFTKAANKKEHVYDVYNTAAYFGYSICGTMVDWAKAVLNTRYAYNLLLPDEGECGYLLPTSEIQTAVQDARRGVKRLLRKVCEY